MIKKLLLLASWLPFAAMAQEKGVHFEHGLSWEKIKAKAKAENKYIFVDCFEECEACKTMSTFIFPQEKVGEFMNAKFLNVKVQMDQTPDDNEEVKKWYDDALKIKKDYVEKDDIIRCPTFLVFSPDGTIVDQQVGGAGDADMFLAKRAASLDPDQQYYPQLEKYKNGQKDTVFLRKLAYRAKEIGDEGIAFAAAKAYLIQQPELNTPDNIDFARAISVNPKNDMMGWIRHSMSNEIPDIIKKLGGVEAKLVEIVGKEEVYAALRTINSAAPDWAAIEKKIKAKYPSIAEQLVLKTKIQYFSDKKDGDNAVANVVAYMKKYGNTADPQTLNEFARTIFKKCNDQKYIEQALEWSKRSFKENEIPAFMDTYANLLYKAGKKADALAWEEKAMNKANGDEKKNYETTLEKMKKGEKYRN